VRRVVQYGLIGSCSIGPYYTCRLGMLLVTVENAIRMFANATSFYQNLCPWGILFNASKVDAADMFWGSECDDESNNLTSEAWCQTCQEDLV
jgi:hypothetical protein